MIKNYYEIFKFIYVNKIKTNIKLLIKYKIKI